jgi:hypothetical protein
MGAGTVRLLSPTPASSNLQLLDAQSTRSCSTRPRGQPYSVLDQDLLPEILFAGQMLNLLDENSSHLLLHRCRHTPRPRRRSSRLEKAKTEKEAHSEFESDVRLSLLLH